MVQCDCGNQKIVTTGVLNNGSTRSCRCLQKEVASEVCTKLGESQKGIATKHGHYINNIRSAEYQSWSGMRDRCERAKHTAYKDYGGRGISICPQWRDENGFETFLRDMGPRPKGKTLDRIDVNGNYEPTNCKWSTYKEQAGNRREYKAIENFTDEVLITEMQRRGLLEKH